MNNREIFEVVEIEVIAFDAEDIIRTSDASNGNIVDGGFSFGRNGATWNP
ncbi:MAG: hypothetical protein IJY37_01005 [Clostridia bacterium]|nr:hypothetical protein [Clostridia bacterium]